MPWFQVDDQLSFHPKAVAAGNGAMGLWVRAGSWCALHMTGGRIPREIARSMGTAAQINKLIGVGLWTEGQDDYEFHQWGERQMSREDLEERRRKRAEAGRKGGQKSGESRRAGSKSEANGSADASSGSAADGKKISESENKSLLHSGAHSVAGTSGVANVEFSNLERVGGFPPGQTIMNGEPSASASARPNAVADTEQTLKQNRTPVPVPVLNGGHLGGNGTKVTREIRASAPPKYHPGHETGYLDGCAECDQHAAAYEAWVIGNIPDPDAEPPRYCPRHPIGSPDPCRACQHARQNLDLWHAEHARQLAEAAATDRHHAAEVRRAAIAACELCDAEGYAGTTLCDHDPETADRARRGIAAARAALAHRKTAS